MAAFGQAILNLSDNWQLTLGGRYTWEEKEAEQTNYVSDELFPVGNQLSRAEFDALENYIHDIVIDPENPYPHGKDDWTEFNPSATLTMFTPDSWHNDFFDGGMIYTSASNGFKAGGFSPFGDNFLAYDPEELWTYELGFKLDLWGQRARLNGAFYYSEYDDIQVTVTRTFPAEDPSLPPVTQNGTANAGEATMTGAELEFSIMPVEGLFLAATAAYIDAEYDEFIDLEPQADGTIAEVDRSDEDFAYTPEQTYSLTAQYDWSTEFGSIVPRVSGYYVSSVFLGLDTASAAADESYLDSYEVWNFRLSVLPNAIEGLEVAGYVNNFTDEEYFGTGIASISGVGAVSLVPGKQMTYGVEVHYDW